MRAAKSQPGLPQRRNFTSQSTLFTVAAPVCASTLASFARAIHLLVQASAAGKNGYAALNSLDDVVADKEADQEPAASINQCDWRCAVG